MTRIRRAGFGLITAFLVLVVTPVFANAQAAQPTTAAPAATTADEYVGKGYEALRQDRYDAAVDEFALALRIDPKLALRARFPMAVALFELHKNADARRELETVQREAGSHPNISYYLGRVDVEDRNFKSAINNLTKAAMAPPFPDTSYYLGFAYAKLEDWKSAERWLDKASRDLPKDARVPFQLSLVYRKQGRNEEAQTAATLAEDIRRQQDDASRLRNDCAKKLDQGPREEARKFCDQLYDADDADKLTELGTIYAQHGDLESAIKPLTRAAELSPQSPQMQYNLALADYQLQHYEEARNILSPSMQRWPDLFQVNALYGAIQLQLGALEEAYTALHHAYQINPRESATGDMLFEACISLARKDKAAKQYAAAIALLQEAVAVRVVEPMPHREMAEIYRLTGKLDSAKQQDTTADQLAAALSPRK
jgi:tetratricopeptide (TPR) repeat protein